MANIGTAQVEDIHIPDGAVSEYAVGNGTAGCSATVSNDGAQPVELWFSGIGNYFSQVSGESGSYELIIKRSRDGAVLYDNTASFSGTGSASKQLIGQVIDFGAQANETYALTTKTVFNASGGGGTGGYCNAGASQILLIAARK